MESRRNGPQLSMRHDDDEYARHEIAGHAKANRKQAPLGLNRLSSLLCLFLLRFEDCGRSEQIRLKSPA